MKHKDLQEAVKNLNAVLSLDPKISHIGTGQALKNAIINTISPLVEAEDERVDGLADHTIATYNLLCEEVAPSPVTEETAAATPVTEIVDIEPSAPEVVEEGVAVDSLNELAQEVSENTEADEGDCFGVSYNPETPADCCNAAECGRFDECVAIVTDKKKKKKTVSKTAKGTKKVIERSPFGHKLEAQAGKLDLALAAGATMEQLVAAGNCGKVRVQCHLQALKRKGFKVTKNEEHIYTVST
jgi:hypothetical protein